MSTHSLESQLDVTDAPAPDWTPARSNEPSRNMANAAASRSRVLHIINGEHYAGAERAQDLLAAKLPDFGYDVTFVCLKPGRFAEMRQSQSTPLINVPMNGRFDLRPARAIAKLVRTEGYSLIHTHTPRSAFVGSIAAAMAHVPLVHHVHSPTTEDSTHRVRDRITALVERLSLTRVAAVIPVSHSMERYIRGYGIKSPKISVIPNGVPSSKGLAQRSRPTDLWTIGVMALFRPRKGLDVLLTAFSQLRSQGYPVRLRCVGRFETPEYEAQIMEQVSRLGIADAIDWRGFQRDVQAELDAMDLFVLPSLFGEGLPFVLLEAMSAGVPVVGTDVEGIPEVLRHEQDGVIAPPGDADALANSIRSILDGELDWEALRSSAFHRQVTCYTDVTMAGGVAKVYSAVLNGRSKK